MLNLILVTIVCWSLAAWLIWKWDIGGGPTFKCGQTKKMIINQNKK